MNQETRLKKAHIALMKHPETALYSGVIMMGESKVVDDCPTAYTDGMNKMYGREFISKLSDEELRALILHENLHVALKHIQRFKAEWKEDPQLCNASADYVVNDVICNLADKTFLKLPDGGLYDEKYHDWSVREVMNDLRQKKDEDGQQPESSMDEHGFDDEVTDENGQPMTAEQQEQLSGQIDRALREGSILAGRMGGNVPRQITKLLAPKVDWKDVLREFITSHMRGTDEYTWRRYNKRLVANDIYMPSVEDEAVGELTIAVDTSASIGERELNAFSSELVSICSVTVPEKIRVLWWDTVVHGEQEFLPHQYDMINKLLKPQGGGGTEVNCVTDYINKHQINSEAIIVFTDGHFFSKPEWNISTPTLFVSTESDEYIPDNCKVVKQELEPDTVSG